MKTSKGFKIFWIGYIVIFILILIILICGCGQDSGTHVIITDPNPIPPIEYPEPPEEAGAVQIVLHTQNETKFFDGTNIWIWQEGNVQKAQTGIYSHENVIYKLDARGATAESRNLIISPDLISLDPVGIVTKGETQLNIDLGASGIWIIENISPQEAYDMGAQYKDYTRVFNKALEYGNWWENQFFCDKIIVHNTDIFARNPVGAWRHINGAKENVHTVIENGFAIWDYDGIAHTAIIDGVSVSWNLNFLNNTKYWQKSGDIWYSERGYTWDGTNLNEWGSSMTNWRTAPYDTGFIEAPVIIPAGTRFENGEDVIYWIECNSGNVIRYVPSVDQYIVFVRLYTGDGLRTTGIYYYNLLKPVIAEEYLYFIFDAQVYRYNFTTQLSSLFTGGVSEIWNF